MIKFEKNSSENIKFGFSSSKYAKNKIHHNRLKLRTRLARYSLAVWHVDVEQNCGVRCYRMAWSIALAVFSLALCEATVTELCVAVTRYVIAFYSSGSSLQVYIHLGFELELWNVSVCRFYCRSNLNAELRTNKVFYAKHVSEKKN